MSFFRLLTLFAFISLTSVMVMANPKSATIGVSTELYAEADKTSVIRSQLDQGTKVTVLQRQGNWYEISTDNPSQTGWVRSYFVQVHSSESWLQRMSRFMRGESPGRSTTTATIGIRGLGPGDVQNATPDMKELEKLDNYKVDINTGLGYASSAKLQSQEVAYLQANHVEEANKGLFKKSSDKIGDVANDVGKSLGGAMKGLKGFFGSKKDEK